MTRLDWEKANRRDTTPRRRTTGITNAQAKYLAALQRRLHEPYTGRGMTRDQAAIAIKAAKTALERRKKRRSA